MPYVALSRCYAFTATGQPLFREMPADTCAELGLINDFYGARNHRFTAEGKAVLATCLKCCDELSQCKKVESDCVAGGISPKIVAYALSVENCASAQNQMFVLQYCKPPSDFSVASSDNSAGDVAWTDPENAFTSDDVRAVAVLDAGEETHYLKLTGTCFKLASGVSITNVEVKVEAHADSTDIEDVEVKLVVGGVITGNNLASNTGLAGTDTVVSYSDTPANWGVPGLDYADVNDSEFGVALRFANTGASDDLAVRVDHVEIILTLCGAPQTPPAGCDDCEITDKSKWFGSLTLRGGTLDFELCCFDNGSGDTVFRLIWWGCNEGCSVDTFPDCVDPLFLTFQLTVDDCCDCAEENTIGSGSINLYLVANCRQTVLGRCIAFANNGEPIFAQQNTCPWSGDPPCGCVPRCGLVMTITNVSGCACLAGTYTLPHTSLVGGEDPLWENINVGACTAPATVTLLCEVNLDGDGNPDGTVTLTLNVVCGATNIGFDTLVVNCEDLEDLDETFTVDMTEPDPGTCGTCTYQWNAMAASWSIISTDCTGGCTCVSEITLAPGIVDGQTQVLDCEGAASTPCCEGTISVRIMR